VICWSCSGFNSTEQNSIQLNSTRFESDRILFSSGEFPNQREGMEASMAAP
jgi:hypothetical protein